MLKRIQNFFNNTKKDTEYKNKKTFYQIHSINFHNLLINKIIIIKILLRSVLQVQKKQQGREKILLNSFYIYFFISF